MDKRARRGRGKLSFSRSQLSFFLSRGFRSSLFLQCILEVSWRLSFEVVCDLNSHLYEFLSQTDTHAYRHLQLSTRLTRILYMVPAYLLYIVLYIHTHTTIQTQPERCGLRTLHTVQCSESERGSLSRIKTLFLE